MPTAMEWWEEELKSLTPETRKTYHRHFNKFLERYGLTAEQLYDMHDEALKSEDRRDRKRVPLMVRDYMMELEERGFEPGSIRNMVKPIKSFFSANELEFKIKQKDAVTYNGQKVILPEQIRKLFHSVGAEFELRNQALIMFLKDSGLRVSDVSNLNVGDYDAAEEPPAELGRFKVFQARRTQKTNQFAHIHIGPEVIHAVDRFLDERRVEAGELLPDAPLFIGRNGKRLSGNSITSQFRRLCERLGNGTIQISAHSFRKFHKTYLESAGMPENWIKRLQGKATSEYSHPEQTGKLTEAYIEKYPVLMIFGADELSRQKQERRIEELEDRLDKMMFLEKIPVEALEAITQSYKDGSRVTIGLKRPGEPDPIMVPDREPVAVGDDGVQALEARGYEIVEQIGTTSTGKPLYKMRLRE